MLASRLREVRSAIFDGAGADTEGDRYVASVSVWGRWVVWAVVIAEAAYRPEFNGGTYIPFVLLHIVVVGGNGLMHYRVVRRKATGRSWVLALSVMDCVIITASVISDGGFDNFHYLAYYPALALVAVISPSFTLSLVWTTVVAAGYALLCLTLVSGIDFGAGEEVVLSARLLAMYFVVMAVNVVALYERTRRRRTAERERALLEERVELSQTIHDTAAQSAYMLGLGIDTARMLAGESNEKLNDTLAAASRLSKSIIWELRGPIDRGLIFEGVELGPALMNHTETFGTVTSVSADVVQFGDEPQLPVETRSRLFSIAHNALANALLHAGAESIEVTLDFRGNQVLLSVSDNGVGLPDDYAERGRGFGGMRADAERMGGNLIVTRAGQEGGTTVTCVVPLEQKSKGD